MEILGCFVALIVVVVSYFLILKSRSRRGTRQPPPPPGNRGYPIFGETFSMFTTPPSEFVKSHREKYGDIFSSYLISNPTIVSSTRDANKFFLEQDGSKFCGASKLKSMRSMLGKHQVNQVDGQTHCKYYKLILSQMLPEVLKTKVQKIDEIANGVLDSWNKAAPIATKEELEKFTFSTIALFVCDELGANNVESLRAFDDTRALTRGIVTVPINIPFTVYSRALKARGRLVSYLNSLILERQASKTIHNDVMHALMNFDENGSRLSNEEVIDNTIACLFAGHHTSATTLVWVMKYLHENPAILKEVQNEHQEIARKKKNSPLTWEDTRNMSLTWRVIQETLRLSSVPPAVIREIHQDVLYQGYRFPKGWNLILNFTSVHLNEEHFPSPSTFDPSRFEMAPKHGTFTPFGAGNRACAGTELARLEMLIFIHRLVTKYKWEPTSPKKRANYRMLPTIENGYPVQIHDI